MSVSKRVRYEVLRRDGYRCRYCGTTADATELRTDHVVPVALGGSDDPSNLVASCVDCNAGKTSTSPDEPLVAQVTDDAIRWAEALKVAAQQVRAEGTAAELDQAWFRQQMRNHMPGIEMHPSWRSTLGAWLSAGLEREDIVEMMWAADRSRADDKWKYLCGCCWTRVRQVQSRARLLLVEERDVSELTLAESAESRATNKRMLSFVIDLVDAYFGNPRSNSIYLQINEVIESTGIDMTYATGEEVIEAVRAARTPVGAL